MIGDAAHAIGPTTGQGANLAIEDAFALACCIAAHRNDIGHALERYEAIRRPSVEYVREYERTTSAVRVSSDPAVIAARERMIRTGSVDELLSRIRPVSSPAAFHAVPEYAMLGAACQQGHA
jgi:2-polyprenyl-6-methoxyphenol hydroxylase-like FAD-dependent oxidoreductase